MTQEMRADTWPIASSHGLWTGVQRQRDWLPYAMTVVIFLAAYLTLVGSFWPYMIPFSVTIWDAAAPPQSLAFMFYGAGIVVFPVVLIYTVAVYWIFRGKVHDSLALSRQASTGHDVRAQLSRQ